MGCRANVGVMKSRKKYVRIRAKGNPALKKRVFKSIRRYENLALKAYSQGKMKEGNKYEKKSDSIYAKNYKKMFGRK